MPSFAKDRGSSEKGMADVFSDEGVQDVLQTVKSDARSRVKELIQREIPIYIAHLTGLLAAAEVDQSSPLWKGHLNSGPFVKENVKLVFSHTASEPGGKKETGVEELDAAQKEQANHGTPTIVIEGVDALSLEEPRPASKETNSDCAQHKLKGERPEELGKRWEGQLELNEVCGRLMDMVEVECEKSFIMGRDLAYWLRLEVPTMEDGNNFGVDVQDEVIRKVDNLVNASLKFHGLPKSHYDDRMGLAMQWNKFPNLKDHAAAIASSDRYDFFLGHNAIVSLRNNMSALLTALRNNWAKAHNPKDAERTSAVDSMY